jgi:hypothetical protein
VLLADVRAPTRATSWALGPDRRPDAGGRDGTQAEGRHPAELGERYGYINRVLPDAGLSGFGHAFAGRIAGFDPGLAAFFRSSGRRENAGRDG